MAILDTLKNLYERAVGLVTPQSEPDVPAPNAPEQDQKLFGSKEWYMPWTKPTIENVVKWITAPIVAPIDYAYDQTKDYFKWLVSPWTKEEAPETPWWQLGTLPWVLGKQLETLWRVGYSYMEGRDMDDKFHKSNIDTFKKMWFNETRWAGDWNKLDVMSQLYAKKNELMNDPNISIDQKATAVNQIQDEIEATVKSFSRYKDDNTLTLWEIEDVSKKYIQHKNEVATRQEKILPTTPEEEAENNFNATKRQEKYDQITGPVAYNILQWKKYRWMLLDWESFWKTVWSLITDYNMDHILLPPERAKEMAQKWLAEATNEIGRKYYQKKLDKANKQIEANNERVIPYIRWMAANLWSTWWKNFNQLTDTYLKMTWQDIEDIFWEMDAVNAIGSISIWQWITGAKWIYNSITGGSHKAADATIKDLMLNRWDVAEQDIAEMRFMQGNLGQKVMEWIGLVRSKWIESPLNTIKWQFYLGWPIWWAWRLWRMDMESLANIDTKIAPPKGRPKKTRETLRNFYRRGIQMGPEIAAQIIPFWEGAKALDLLGDTKLISKLSKMTRVAEETAGLMKAGEDISVLSSKIAKYWPEFEKLVKEWKTATEAIKLISKQDYFAGKMFSEPAKLLLNNYIQSATMQTHNPNAYSTQNFFFDTAFWFLDWLITTQRLLKNFQYDNIKYRDMFLDTMAKKYRDIPENDRKLLTAEDKVAFQQATQQYIAQYNDAIKKMDPDEIKAYMARWSKQNSQKPVSMIVNDLKKVHGEDYVPAYTEAITQNIIPDYIGKKDYDNIFAAAHTEEDAYKLLQDLKIQDRTLKLKWATVQEQIKAAKETLSNFVMYGKLVQDPGVGVFKNFIKDVHGLLWTDWIIKIDWETYKYKKVRQNLDAKAGEIYKDESWAKIVSKWNFNSQTYYLAKEWEEFALDANGNRYIKDENGMPIGRNDYKERKLKFFQVKDWGETRWTWAGDKYWKSIDEIQEVNKITDEEEILANERWFFKDVDWVYKEPPEIEERIASEKAKWLSKTTDDIIQEQKILKVNDLVITPTAASTKLGWFSTLNDALLKSNIPNNDFLLSKAKYNWPDRDLYKSLKATAEKWIKLTTQQFETFKDFAIQSAIKFFPQYPELLVKIEKKLNKLNLTDVTIRDKIKKLDEAAKVAEKNGDNKLLQKLTQQINDLQQAENTPLWLKANVQRLFNMTPTVRNDVSVLSRLAWEWGLWEFLKFFDPFKYSDIKKDMNEFKKFWNVDFPDVDRNRYRTLWKYISNDTAESTIIKRVNGVLGADVYKIGQTVANFSGMPKMLIMNSLAFTVEQMKKYNIRNFSNNEMYNFRKKYNMLFSTDELEALGHVDNAWVLTTAKWLLNKVIELYNSWLYNAADVFYSSSIKNQSVWQAIEEILPQLKNMDEVDAFLKNLPEVDRLTTMKQIQQRAEQLKFKRTWQFWEFWKGKTTFAGEEPGARTKTKEAAYWMYSLMGSWWMWMLKSSAETIAQTMSSKLIRGSFWKDYLMKLQNEWKLAADKWALEFSQKSDDFSHFAEKMNLAMTMWFKQDRLISDDDWQTDLVTTLREWYELWKNYSFPLQSFESMPFWRAFLAFIEWMFNDVNNDGKITWMDVAAGWVNFWKQVVTDFFRRFSIPKSIIRGTSEAISKWHGLRWWVKDMTDAFVKATGWYLYYSSQEVTNNWFDLYIPLTPKSFLMEIIPYTDKYLKEYRKLSWKLGVEKILTDRWTYWSAWLMNNIPLLKEVGIWKMEDEKDTSNVTDLLYQDTFYRDKILKWDVDRDVMWDRGKLYAYAQLTNMSSFSSEKNPQAWFDDMRKNFNFIDDTWVERVRPARQNQEDAFVDLMKDALKDWAYDTFKNLFNQSVNWNQKAAIQMMAFAEEQSPWSGKEILANIVSWERFRLLGENWWFIAGGIDPKVSSEIQKYLWAKYGNLVFTTDKPVWRKNISLFYAREKYPQIWNFLTDPNDKNWNPSRDINFIYEKDKGEEEEYKNNIKTQIYVVDMIGKIKVANGDSDWWKMANAMSVIYMPKTIDMKSLAFNWIMTKSINHLLNYINTSHLSTEEKTEMKSWVFVWIYNKIAPYIKYMFDPKTIMTPELEENKSDLMETMRFLHWTSDEITEAGKEKWMQEYFKATFWTSFWNSKYYSDKPLTYTPWTMYDKLQALSYLYSPYRTYGTSKNYSSKYYSPKDRDYLVEYWKWRGQWIPRVSDFGKAQPDKTEPSGRTPSQKSGSARPFTKLEDPDKPFDFANVATFKRKFTRKAVKYDNRSTWGGMTKWWLYNVSYQGRDRKRRVSRTKGGDTKGSAKYNKTRW